MKLSFVSANKKGRCLCGLSGTLRHTLVSRKVISVLFRWQACLPRPFKELLFLFDLLHQRSARGFSSGGVQLGLQAFELFVHVGQFGLTGLELLVEYAEITLALIAAGESACDVDGRDLIASGNR